MNPHFCLRQRYSERMTVDGDIVPFPGLRITFRHGRYEETIGNALLDTGADQTLLPLSMAVSMGFRFDLDQDKVLWDGAGGKQFAVYKSPVVIEHILKSQGFRDYSWKSFAYFTVEQPTVLLGREGCLDNFVVTFDGRNQITEIRSH